MRRGAPRSLVAELMREARRSVVTGMVSQQILTLGPKDANSGGIGGSFTTDGRLEECGRYDYSSFGDCVFA